MPLRKAKTAGCERFIFVCERDPRLRVQEEEGPVKLERESSLEYGPQICLLCFRWQSASPCLSPEVLIIYEPIELLRRLRDSKRCLGQNVNDHVWHCHTGAPSTPRARENRD